MKSFTRALWLAGFLVVFVLAYYASVQGYGLANLGDKKIKEDTRGGGSYFSGRTVRGGGMRYGK